MAFEQLTASEQPKTSTPAASPGFQPLSQAEIQALSASQAPNEYEQFKASIRGTLPQSGLGAAGQAAAQPFKLAGGLAGGIYDLVKGGAQGIGTLLGKGSVDDRTKGAPTLSEAIKEGLIQASIPLPLTTQQKSDLLQTGAEAIPRFAIEGLGVPIRQGVDFAVQDPEKLARNFSEFANPVNAFLNYYIKGVEPKEEEYQRMFERYKQSQLQSKLLEAPILPEAVGEANIPAARAAPLLLGAETLPGAIEASVRALPNLVRQTGRTLGTLVSTPQTIYQAGKAAEPFLSGARAAGAKEAVDAAVARQSTLEGDITASTLKQQMADAEALKKLSGERSEAAVKGREALIAGRELKTAQGTIAPEIVQAQTSLEQASQLPPVILGKNPALAEPAFGKIVLQAIEKPLEASKGVYTDLYNAVEQSLPAKQVAAPAQPLYDAAIQGKAELSDGFEAFNKGVIKRILDESTKLTKVESTGAGEPVSDLIRNVYNNAKGQAKADLLKNYPGLAEIPGEVITKIPEYTWSELQQRFRQINQGINDALKYGNNNDARILGNLKDGILQSMEDYAQQMGPQTFDLFKQANKAYAEHQGKFGLNRIQTLFRDDVLQNPEMVAKKLLTYENPSQVEAIKAVVSPEEFATVQSQFAQKLLSPNANVPFDPAHFVKQFGSPEARATVEAVFGKQGLADFTQLNEAAMDFAKIGDLQKTVDSLSTQSEKATKAFENARAGIESKKVLAEKKIIEDQIKAISEEKVRSKLAGAAGDVEIARRELDSVKNYRQLKDWATRFSGLNILDAATRTPDWARLSRYAALHLNEVAQPDGEIPDQ